MINNIPITKSKHISFSKENFFIRNGENLVYSMIIALFIVFVCTLFDKNFFFYDDAHNEFLPFFKSIGKVWLKGEIPFIIKNTFIGQNQMVDIHRAIFLPQNILFSIISTKIHSFVVLSLIISFFNISLVSFFSLKIGEALNLDKRYKILVSFLFCINPVFLYFYLSSWWCGAPGVAWFVGTLASIFLLRKEFCIKNIVFNVVTTISLFCTGWTHSIISYIVVLFIFLIEYVLKKKYKEIIIFLIILFGVFLIIINFYSEYIISSNLLERNISFGNFDNFFAPSFNHLVMTFNPVYNNFIHRFQGYLPMYIPIGYSSIYILFLLCFCKNFFELFKDKNMKFILYLLLSSLILVQSPTRLGPLQFSFRFLPYYSEIMIIFSVYGLYKGKLEFNKKRVKVFVVVILISSILAFFSIQADFKKIFIANVIFIFVTLCYLYTVVKKKKILLKESLVYSAIMLILMLFVQNSINGILPFIGVKTEINKVNKFNNKGYILSLTNGEEPRNNIEDLFASEFLLYDLKSINGYSPTGNKKILESINTIFAQHIFTDEGIVTTIDNLSKKYNEVCYFDLMNIESIPIYRKNLSNDMKTKLESCRFFPREVQNKNVIYFIKSRENTIGNISYFSRGIKINKMLEDKNNKERYSIDSKSLGEIILSKVYWPGYRAYINNKKVKISNEKGLIKIKDIPNGLKNAELKIEYFPASWKITLWFGIAGIFEILITLIYLQYKQKKEKYNIEMKGK